MTLTETRTETRTLPDDLLARCRERAARYDRDNRFFDEDFAELRDLGYLTAALPAERGGWGLTLAELATEQRRLARHAPATALALTMHHYWVGMAADLVRMGDPSCEFVLDEVAAGAVIAAGHAEAGNDAPVVMSTAVAVPVEGGWKITGRKHFGSLSPVCTVFSVHALDATDPANPVIVHAFIDRATPGITTVETWDTLAMRATQSHDTILDEVFVPAERCIPTPAGSGAHPFVGVMSAWALPLIGNVYVGIAERALELAVTSAQTKTSVSLPRGATATNPFVQHQVAEMFIDLHGARAALDAVLADWSNGVDHGAQWGALIPSAKAQAVAAAQRVVNRAMDVVGGSSLFRGHELERLYRDVRAGGFHPATDAYAHELVAKVVLGFGEGEPRF